MSEGSGGLGTSLKFPAYYLGGVNEVVGKSDKDSIEVLSPIAGTLVVNSISRSLRSSMISLSPPLSRYPFPFLDSPSLMVSSIEISSLVNSIISLLSPLTLKRPSLWVITRE